MEELHYEGWEVRYDGAATRRAFQETKHGGAEACGCVTCRNYIQARQLAYPRDFLHLLERLGVDSRSEREVYWVQPDEQDQQVYSGWFHFIGRVVQAREGMIQLENLSFYFTNETALVPKRFEWEGPVAQIEFTTTVPWLLKGSRPR